MFPGFVVIFSYMHIPPPDMNATFFFLTFSCLSTTIDLLLMLEHLQGRVTGAEVAAAA